MRRFILIVSEQVYKWTKVVFPGVDGAIISILFGVF